MSGRMQMRSPYMNCRRAGIVGESPAGRNEWVARLVLLLALVLVLPAHAYAAALGSSGASVSGVLRQVPAPATPTAIIAICILFIVFFLS